jgi:hypothetical protein
MRLICYVLGRALKMVAAGTRRKWMDETPVKYAYRCIPLTFANGSGWELLSPCTFSASWNGGSRLEDIYFEALDGYPYLRDHVCSHFGSGIITIHPGFLMQTEPGWGLTARGSPNMPKDGIHALEGLIETDWLPFTFTMNWIFTRPGRVVFEKDEPLCFVQPVQHMALDDIQPEISSLNSNPVMKAEYEAWSASRNQFNAGLKARDPEIMKQGWQKGYVRGKSKLGTLAPETHMKKRRLQDPVKVLHPKPMRPLPNMDLPLTNSPRLTDVGIPMGSIPAGCPMSKASITDLINKAQKVPDTSPRTVSVNLDLSAAKCPVVLTE